jgi:chromosome segregation ATPase
MRIHKSIIFALIMLTVIFLGTGALSAQKEQARRKGQAKTAAKPSVEHEPVSDDLGLSYADKSLTDRALEQINPENIDYGSKLKRWKWILTHATLHNPILWACLILGTGLFIFSCLYFVETSDRKKERESLLGIVTDFLMDGVYAQHKAKGVIAKYNAHMESCNRDYEDQIAGRPSRAELDQALQKIAEADARNEDLQREKRVMEDEMLALREKVEKTPPSIEGGPESLQAEETQKLKEVITQLEKDLAWGKESKSGQKADNSSTLEAIIKKLNEELQAAKNAGANLAEEKQKLTAEISVLRSAHNTGSAQDAPPDAVKLNMLNADLEKKWKTEKAEREKLAKLLGDANTKIKQIEMQLRKAGGQGEKSNAGDEAKNSSLESEKSKLANQLAQAKSEINTLTAKINKVPQETSATNNETAEELRRKLAQVIKDKKVLEEIIADLKQKAETAKGGDGDKAEIEKLVRQVDELTQAVRDKGTENEKLVGQLVSLQDQSKNRQGDTKDVERMGTQIKLKDAVISKQTAEIVRLNNTIAAQNNRIEELGKRS